MAVAIANTNNWDFSDFTSTPQTTAAISAGVAAADRILAVTVQEFSGDADGNFASSVTIGGVGATKGVFINDASGKQSASIWWAFVPTGTTAVVSFSFSSTPTNNSLQMALFRIVGSDTTSPFVSTNTNNSATAHPSASITIPPNGALLAITTQTVEGSDPTFTSWTNATNSFGSTLGILGGTATMRYATGLSTTSGSPTVTANWSTSALNNVTMLALAAIKIPGGATNKSVSVSQAKTATLRKASLKSISIAQVKVATLRRNMTKMVAISQGKTATLSRAMTKRFSIAQAKIASIVPAAVRPKSLTISQGKIAVLVRVYAKNQLVNIAQGKVAALGIRQINRFISITQGKTATLRKAISHGVISISQAKVARVFSGSGKLIQVSQGKIAILQPPVSSRIIRVTQAKAATLRRSMERTVRVTQGKVASIVVRYAKNVTVLITQIKTATLRARPATTALPVQTLKNIITRVRIIKNITTRVRILKNIVTRRIP